MDRPMCHECVKVENCMCVEPKSERFNQRVINVDNPLAECAYFEKVSQMRVDFNMNYGYQMEE